MWGQHAVHAAGAVTPPVWSTALMWGGFTMWGGAWVADWFLTDLWVRRRLYWYCTVIGSGLCAAAVLFQGWATALFGFGALCVSFVVIAVRWTPFLKFRGRIIAASYSDRMAETPSRTTEVPAEIADKSGPPLWWTAVGWAATACMFRVTTGWSLATVFFTAGLALFLALLGYDDGRRRFPFARRLRVQASLVTALTLPVFAIPAAVYAAAYRAGTHEPISFGKHDAEACYYHRTDSQPEQE